MFSNYNCRNNDVYIKIMKDVSNSISWGDVIETSIYTDQNWFLQENIHAFYTTINTSYNLNKYPKNKQEKAKISFSSDLNKTSLKNINRKNISILKQNMPNKVKIVLYSYLGIYSYQLNITIHAVQELICDLISSFAHKMC